MVYTLQWVHPGVIPTRPVHMFLGTSGFGVPVYVCLFVVVHIARVNAQPDSNLVQYPV